MSITSVGPCYASGFTSRTRVEICILPEGNQQIHVSIVSIAKVESCSEKCDGLFRSIRSIAISSIRSENFIVSHDGEMSTMLQEEIHCESFDCRNKVPTSYEYLQKNFSWIVFHANLNECCVNEWGDWRICYETRKRLSCKVIVDALLFLSLIEILNWDKRQMRLARILQRLNLFLVST